MSYLLPTKLCLKCNKTLEIEQFYKAGKYRQKHCKPCYNEPRKKDNKIYKIGINTFSLEERKAITNDIQSGMKLKEVAKKNNISYQRLCRFKRRKLL